jgi:hypothetical protein
VLIIGLLLSVSLAVPTAQAQQLTLAVSVEETIFETGAVLVTGTVTCSEPTVFTDAFADVRQPVGRFKTIRGFAGEPLGPCEEESPFELLVLPESGSFKPGTAFLFVSTSGCLDAEATICDSDSTSLVVKLRK